MSTTFDVASQNSAGVLNGNSQYPSISADGTLVAFESLDPVTMHEQIYVKNESTSTLTLLSQSSSGVTGNQASTDPVLSANGATVTFSSASTNLVAGAVGTSEIYTKTIATQGLQLVSQTQAGVVANAFSTDAATSADGNIIAFDSSATNLSPLATVGTDETYVKNQATGVLTLASQTSAGTVANANAATDGISLDGNLVVFQSAATDLGSSNGQEQIYVKNVATGALTIVSESSAGVVGNASSFNGNISSDGLTAVFDSTATNLVAGATSGVSEIYAKNLSTGAITLVSQASNGIIANGTSSHAVASADGKYVMFESTATNLDPAATSGTQQVYVKNLQSGAISLLSKTASGVAGNDTSSTPFGNAEAFSADGSTVAFATDATNLAGTAAGTEVVLRATTTGPALTENPVAGDNIVSAAELGAATFSGTSDAIGGTVQVALDTATNVIGTTIVQANGTWSLTANVGPLAQGAHTEIATVQGTSYLPTTASHAFTVNSVGPTTAFNTGVHFTSEKSAVLTGTVSDPTGVTGLELFSGSKDLGAATLKANGDWKLSATLERGIHGDITAVATDTLGNTSTTAAPFSLQTGIQGAPYTTDEEDYDATGNVTAETLTKQHGGVYLSDYVEKLASGNINYNYTNGSFFDDKSYYFYTDTYNADFSPSSETLFDDDGSHTVTGLSNGQTLTALGDDTMTGDGRHQTFLFNPHPGQELITDFQATGQGHDIIALPKSSVSSIAQALHDVQQDGNDAVLTIGPHLQITLQNVVASSLNPSDFKLHA